MNRILMMMIMVVMMLGLTASYVSADFAVHVKNHHVQYNELSASEFFYGVVIDNGTDAAVAGGNALSVLPADDQWAIDPLTNAEFFYGYSIPERLGTTFKPYDINACNWTAGMAQTPEISDPSLFFGYADTGFCINC